MKIYKKIGAKTMNIFEDLIEELKEDNLIEQTVIETSQIEEEEKNKKSTVQPVKIEDKSADQTNNAPLPESSAVENVLPTVTKSGAVDRELPLEINQISAADASEKAAEPNVNEAEFYRQKAINEVSFLQMVEAAFAGLEREQLKIVPRPFDDLKVKKVLHLFLQVSRDGDSSEYSKAEFQLLKETESWYSSLSLRDMRFMTAHLRRFCETSRPPLSSPAIVALARFYRNSPYSELVRSKFDLMVTRLFSKEIGASKREVVFSRDELLTHLQELYADWSSVPLYSTEVNDAEILQLARKFEDFMAEAEAAQSFDELINNNFFNRLRHFKENSNENFYAPAVAAAAIECNICVGNLYVELLEKEKGKGNVAGLENKYGLSHDQAISEATGKTFSLVELLKEKTAPPPPVEEKEIIFSEPMVREEGAKTEKSVEKQSNEKVKSKKWMFSLAIAAAIILVGIYFATKSNPGKVQEVQSSSKMNLENSMLREYLLEASIEDATLKGVVLPTWNHLTTEKKKDALKQMLNFGGDKGYKKVQLENKDRKTVATAADGDVSILD